MINLYYTARSVGWKPLQGFSIVILTSLFDLAAKNAQLHAVYLENITLPEANELPPKNSGWKTILSFWVLVAMLVSWRVPHFEIC